MTESPLFGNKDYQVWLIDLKTRIRKSQLKAAVKVNSEMIELYWSIGADIDEKQKNLGWGGKVIPQLSADLRSEFPDTEGFSQTNLKLMKRFYSFYCKLGTRLVPNLHDEIIGCQPGTQLQGGVTQSISQDIAGVSYELPQVFTSVPWRHHVEIFRHCETMDKALFFIRQTIENSWSRGVLLNFLDTDLYERQGKAITNFNRALPEPQSDLANETLKDPYNFDFLTLTKGYKERELEDALAENITKFLLELGSGFAFVGRQIHLEVGESEVFLDLLFYHLDLKCFVVIELKATDFKAEYLGQLGLYISAVNHLKKKSTDNPTIGLLICKTKDNIMVEWSLESSSQPIGISAYELTEALPDELKSTLPSIEEIEATLKDELGG